MKKLIASLIPAVIVLSACANSPSTGAGPSGDALPALRAAIQQTSTAGSSRMAIDLNFTSPERSLHVTGDVAYVLDPSDPTSLRERALLNIPSMGMVPGGEVELIVGKGSVVYVRAPMLASYIPAKTPWVKLDPSSLPQQPGGVGAAAAALDPSAILAALESAVSVGEVGPDTVDGTDATHYRATVDLVKLLPSIAALAPDAPTDADMQEAKDRLTKLGLDALPIELWVDGDGYLKQLRLALDLSTFAPDRPGTSFSLTLTLSDIGEDISIDVPPASQVTDLTDLLGSAFSPAASLA
jgi:hypothetical protein